MELMVWGVNQRNELKGRDGNLSGIHFWYLDWGGLMLWLHFNLTAILTELVTGSCSHLRGDEIKAQGSWDDAHN